MTTDGFTAIAWGLRYDGTGGLKLEVHRRFILIEQFVALGMTNLDTGKFEWTVSKYDSPEAAQERAIALTKVVETWGCTLVDEPCARVIRQSYDETEKWLNTIVGGESHRAGLDATYQRTMRDGRWLGRAA